MERNMAFFPTAVSRYMKVKEESFPLKQICLSRRLAQACSLYSPFVRKPQLSLQISRTWGALGCNLASPQARSLGRKEEIAEIAAAQSLKGPGITLFSLNCHTRTVGLLFTIAVWGTHFNLTPSRSSLIKQPEIRKNVSCRVKSTLNWAG